MKIPLALDKTLLDRGIRQYHTIDFAAATHIMTIGASGSGKTYLNKLIIGKIALHVPDSQTTILDFKSDDYHNQRGSKRLYEYKACLNGLVIFYQDFLDRLEGNDTSRNLRLLIIEELSSMLAYYSKKETDSIKSMLATLILMGRSYNVQCLISTQRPDASLFNSGVRDSISTVIAMGNLSKEGKSMLFKDFEDLMPPLYTLGSGYMIINNTNFHSIQVPQINNIDKLNQYITDSLNR